MILRGGGGGDMKARICLKNFSRNRLTQKYVRNFAMKDPGKYTTFIQKPGDGNQKTVTLLQGSGIGPEICKSVCDIFNEANVPIK